jgi:hypothetical protein
VILINWDESDRMTSIACAVPPVIVNVMPVTYYNLSEYRGTYLEADLTPQVPNVNEPVE